MKIIPFTSNTNRKEVKDKNKFQDNQLVNGISSSNNKKPLIPKIIWIPVLVLITLTILAVIGITIYKKIEKTKKKKNKKVYLDTIVLTEDPSEEVDDGIYTPDLGPLDVEFSVKTKINDLRTIRVEQISKEKNIINGKIEENLIYRITYYDIIFFKERNAEHYQQKYFNKTYTGSIAITKECISIEKEECELNQLIDLKAQNISNSRNLEEINDLKDIPISLCLFEMTDNDVIMSIKCPESLSKGRKDTMVLDLYFFKPPSIERPNKKSGNIKINTEKKGDKIHVRDTDIGMCSIKSPYLSNCTTDFNLTTDLEGNVLSYNELCYSKITKNENNIYIKNKETKLLDVTNNYNNVNTDKYKENLNKFLPLLDPYMKHDQIFNFTQFKQLYNTAKNATMENKERRNLENNNNKKTILQQANIFSYSDKGTDYTIYLTKNPGFNENYFEYLNNFKAGERIFDLVRLREETNFDNILKKLSILSKAGNKLASNLYENIKSDFNILENIIKKNITSLNNLIVYQDMLTLFDSSLSINMLKSLPYKVVEFSDYLINQLDNSFNNIMNDEMKKFIENFKENINNYTGKSLKLVFQIEDNLKNLTKSLYSKKSALTEIATYYLNNTQNSYSDIIIKIEDILTNYYKNESNSIIKKVEKLLENFEINLINSIKSQTQKLNDLLPKLEDKTVKIETGNDEDLQKIVSNIKNSKEYISKIINQIKEKIRKSIGLKDNNYFLTNEEISKNNIIFTSMINTTLDVAQKLDNDEYIDKVFDNIMRHFIVNFTEANQNINKIKEQIFTLTENDYFSLSQQKSLSSDIRDLYVQISLKLKKENNFYLQNLQEKLDNFVSQNKDYLKSIINKLNVLFSEEKLKILANLYDEGFTNSIEIIKNQLENNTILTQTYFDDIKGVILNNSKIVEILYEYKQNNLPYKREEWSEDHYVYLNTHFETISSKKLTQSFNNKYTKFKNNAINSLNYLEDNIFLDFLNEYKKPIIELKKLLQSIKNTKISNLYPDFNDLKFTDENIEKIDKLYIRLNNYIADNIFNKKYVPEINNLKNEEIPIVRNITTNIEKTIDNITYNEIISDISNDFCYAFITIAYYTCTNGQLKYNDTSNDYYCLHLAQYSENYKYIKDISIYNNEYINSFKKEYRNFYSSIEEKVNLYVSKMNELKNILSSVKQETINKKITEGYFLPFEKYINNLLSEKYEDKIIESSYEYYKNDTKTKIESILKIIGDNWNNIYDKLNNEIKEKQNELKSGTYEFGIMAQITSILINGNITKNVFKSIINHQKNEFIYEISYNYNFLLRIIKSAYKSILSGVPANSNGFNDIIDFRKNEIKSYFETLIKRITELKEKSCSEKKQAEILQINEENFFDINDTLYEHINEINESLTTKALYPFNFDLINNEYSFINRFYLENSLIGEKIKELYQETEDKSFIKLKVDEFINLVKKNIIFDKNEFINKIEEIIHNLELNIEKKYYKDEKKIYISKLESIITEQVFTKDRMIEEINNLYKKGVSEMEENKIQEIKYNISEILKEIKKYISSEANTLLTTSVSYTKNYSKINNTLNEYKKEIFNKLNSTALIVIKDFHEEITLKLLKNYIEPMFETFLNKTTEYSCFKEKKTLNQTYNITKIILDIVRDISVEYRNITEMQIEYKYKEYLEKITKKLDLYEIQKEINDEIEKEYELTLLPALIKVAIYNSSDQDYIEYDFNDTIKNKIEEKIKFHIKKINDIVLTTRDYEIQEVNVNGSVIKQEISLFNIALPSYEYCFDEIYPYIEIDNFLNNFTSTEKNDELINFNNSISELFYSYFNELMSEIILSFGNDFFERIIKYNENFKITDLYNNLKYSIFQTISYYIMINLVETIYELPKDLKLKLYSLNNINLIVQEKNNKILDFLEDNIDGFIEESKQEILTFFIRNIQENIIKEDIFNNEINEILYQKLNDMRENDIIDNNYKNLLNTNFKYKFINAYTISMNNQLKELLEIISAQKVQLQAELDQYFTLEPEEVLNDINNNLNITTKSIDEYFNNTFNISENFSNYLNNYGNVIIKPSYEKIINLLDESTRIIILNTLDNNTKMYEQNLNADEFNDLSNMTYLLTKEIYDKIKININKYGIKEYNNNLENEIQNLTLVEIKNIRRLNGETTEEDNQEENKEKIDKGVAEVFQKLLEYSGGLKKFLDGFEELNNFKNNICENFEKLEQSFQKSENQIRKNKYEEDIEKNLTEKLYYLKRIASNYYNSINETFYKLTDYLNNSISEIYDLINQSEYITYKAFSEQYENLSKQVKTLDKKINDMEKEISTGEYKSSWENNNVIAKASFKNIKKEGKFKFYYIYEKGSSPIMRVELIDESRPEKLKLEIEELFGECTKNVQEIEANFNNISFITYIDYNIVKNEINMTTVQNFESYDYDIYKYKKGTSSGNVCKLIMGLYVCTGSNTCSEIGTRTHYTKTQAKVISNVSDTFNP